MKKYILIGLILGMFLLSGCLKTGTQAPEISGSRPQTFWGTATIKAEVLKNEFPDKNFIKLEVLSIRDYSTDEATEQFLSEGDEISILILGEVKPKCTQEIIEKPGKIKGEIQIELGEEVCDETINPYEEWIAPTLKKGDIILIQVRLEGSTPEYSEWMSHDDSIGFKDYTKLVTKEDDKFTQITECIINVVTTYHSNTTVNDKDDALTVSNEFVEWSKSNKESPLWNTVVNATSEDAEIHGIYKGTKYWTVTYSYYSESTQASERSQFDVSENGDVVSFLGCS